MPAFIDLIGKKFGRWTVLGYVGKGTQMWHVICGCGNTAIVSGGNLRGGGSRSCGCLRSDVSRARNTQHGALKNGDKPKAYSIWQAMKKRCSNMNNADYHRYGGRGIKVCERWATSFSNFLADMGECPDGLTLDRIDNDGNYCPENCRWASRKEQSDNKPGVVWVEYQGKRMTAADFARSLGKPTHTVWRNIVKQGLTPEQVAARPSGRTNWRAPA